MCIAKTKCLLLLVLTGLSGLPLFGQAHGHRAARSAFSHDLPTLKGDRLKAFLVEVTYGPDSASPVHTHACPVIGYVVQGAVKMQVKGAPEAIYRAGDSFYERPNGVHLVSANASKVEPAKFVAFFVCDTDKPLSSDVPGQEQR